MAIKLFKLVASATTKTTADPTVYRYIALPLIDITDTQIIIHPYQFVTDDGTTASILQTVNSNNGFYNLFINGELQQTGLYTVTSTLLTIAASAGFTILASAPITLTVTKFAPVSSTVVTC